MTIQKETSQEQQGDEILDNMLAYNMPAESNKLKLRMKMKEKINKMFNLRDKNKDFLKKWNLYSGMVTGVALSMVTIPFFIRWFMQNPNDVHSLGDKAGFLCFLTPVVFVLHLLLTGLFSEAFTWRFKWVKNLFLVSSVKEQKEMESLEQELKETMSVEQFQHEYLTHTLFLIKEHTEKAQLSTAPEVGDLISRMNKEYETLINHFANNDMLSSISVIQKIEQYNDRIVQLLNTHEQQDNNKSRFLEKYNTYLQKNDLQDFLKKDSDGISSKEMQEFKNVL
jgi:hypothetical protein